MISAYIIVLSIVLLGLLLILLDIVVVPGAFVSLAGIIVIGGALIFSYKAYGSTFAVYTGIMTAALSVLMAFIVWKFRLWSVMQLKTKQKKEDGFVSFSSTKE
ncbi:MAG: hypothetical protein ABIA63_04905, partial [bacterium]